MPSPTASTTEQFRAAFTLIDLLLALAIFMLAMSVTMPFLSLFRGSELLAVQAEEVATSLREARRSAVLGEQDLPWGVRFFSGSYVVFAGTGYVARMPEFDAVHDLSAVTTTGLSECIFGKLTGVPNPAGVLSLSSNDQQREIVITAAGSIDVRTP